MAVRSVLLPLLVCCLCCASCGGRQSPPAAVPTVALAVDGPPLALAGEYAGMRLEGTMDRTGMAGYGTIRLKAVNPGADFSCEGSIDAPPTEKGRVRGVLTCSGDRRMGFSLRNIGPDQGVGVARETEHGDLMVIFYHASAEEAKRRFPSVKADIAQARANRP